ncbi:GntR family transcriptional regulator [Paeniroseomonas aquatica]|uniref:GntR family transcriptional regulator n=1 Tax=Paeniroseomonas aquatica TaxID=373043 RepID=UPI0036084EAA
MVEQAAEAIVAAAVRGLFLPGDRLVEAEIARDLGISRVPVREALRLLESQGIVASTPYKGMRLMQVSNAGVASLMRLRLALESLAVQEALRASGGAERFARMSLAAEVYAQACRLGDPAPIVLADEDFHAELCRASGNAPLLALWQSLARQLAVIWGLAQQGGPGPQPRRSTAPWSPPWKPGRKRWPWRRSTCTSTGTGRSTSSRWWPNAGSGRPGCRTVSFQATA